MPPATAVLLPLAAVAPGTPVRVVGDDPRHADALAQLGLAVTFDGAAPWAVAWRTLDRLGDDRLRTLREALLPGGWIAVAVASDTASPADLVIRMEDVGLALAAAPAAEADADGVRVVRGLFRRVDPGVIA